MRSSRLAAYILDSQYRVHFYFAFIKGTRNQTRNRRTEEKYKKYHGKNKQQSCRGDRTTRRWRRGSSRSFIKKQQHYDYATGRDHGCYFKRAAKKQRRSSKGRRRTSREIFFEAAIKRALEQHEAQESTKKRKTEHEFKREGNKIRYNVNEDILQQVENAAKAIDRNDLEAAKDAIEGGKKILTKQQKLIRLADREDNGWEVVKHYLSDDLAEDSDDEKDINRARREALASIKKRQSKKTKSKFRNAPQSYRSYRREYDQKPRYDNRRNGERKGLACYRCGGSGHVQYDCPLRYERRR